MRRHVAHQLATPSPPFRLGRHRRANLRARRLLLLSASERFRARLASDLLAASRLEAKLLAHADEARERQSETRRALRREARRAEAVAKALGEVKRFVERTVSAMYNGRAVHIIGEINNALVV